MLSEQPIPAFLDEKERDKDLLLSLSTDITSCRTREDIQHIITHKLARYFQFNDLLICLNHDDNLTHSCYISVVDEKTIAHPDFDSGSRMKFFINDGIFNAIEESTGPVAFDMDELVSRSNKPFYVDFWYSLHVKEIIGFPLRVNNESIGGATLYPKRKNTFTPAQLRLAQAVCSYIGIALYNIVSYEKIQGQLAEIDRYKMQLEEENLYLQEQIKTARPSDEIIGISAAFQQVFELVSQVAKSDSTVLITGETGTGKELVAQAIHNGSPRRDKLMIKVNCAALPANLVESELFGHERGSFTGAIERRIGKFELANRSTIFLDEVGEMPPELQAKLLRALQEKEIERIGGKAPVKTDVRIIAATNRNLYKEVEAGRFRSDLFYRLNVFPVNLPPLRDRKEDIPVLVAHFINRLSRKSGKKITDISQSAIRDMMLYHWPGNVRELEHLVERSILMAKGTTIKEIHLSQNDKKLSFESPGELPVKTLEQNERDHILTALKKSNGRIRGEGGAAELLGIPPTTLHSKIKKLGIKKSLE